MKQTGTDEITLRDDEANKFIQGDPDATETLVIALRQVMARAAYDVGTTSCNAYVSLQVCDADMYDEQAGDKLP